ncbi:MAG: hypothetical protein JO305_00290 [Alphaproteobacteria bacterium]|nr:hypothetical protein [Alphaproteobacteria bacterium]
MTLSHKILLGLAALLVAGAALFPDDVLAFYRGGYPTDPQKREALQLCQQSNPSFVRFLESDRAACYARMKNAGRMG